MKKSLPKYEIRKKASDYILIYCGNLQQNEKLLFIYDKTTEDLIPLLEETASKITKFIKKIKIEKLSQHGLEPPINVSKKNARSRFNIGFNT